MTTLTTGRFEWGAIIAGTVFALAISIVLIQFGSIIGLSATSPLRGENNIAAWGVIATGIWLLWVQLLASLGGGYIAGRLRTPITDLPRHDSELRDGVAGLITWATSTVLVFIGVSLASAVTAYLTALTPGDQVETLLTDTEQNKSIVFAFVAGATALISAVAAWWAGTVGGEHRDNGTDLSMHLSFRR